MPSSRDGGWPQDLMEASSARNSESGIVAYRALTRASNSHNTITKPCRSSGATVSMARKAALIRLSLFGSVPSESGMRRKRRKSSGISSVLTASESESAA